MTQQERIAFLSEKVKELNKITSEIEELFPEKSFKLDGILIGNIVEVLSAEVYGIALYKQSEKTHDGEANGKKIQIKGTQGKDSIVIREEPEYLLVEYLDRKTGMIREIYNGPGALPWEYRSFVPSMNFYTIRINKLLELDATVPDEDRIPAIIPIEKYKREIVKVNAPKTEGYRPKRKPGNHYNQMAYLMRCNVCGHEYEANGCDVAIRKCPECM